MTKKSKDFIFTILCREYDKYQGRKPIIYVVEHCNDLSLKDLKCMSLRSRFNPELSYFIVLYQNWLENEETIKKTIFKEHEFELFDSFISNGSSDILENRGILRIWNV